MLIPLLLGAHILFAAFSARREAPALQAERLVSAILPRSTRDGGGTQRVCQTASRRSASSIDVSVIGVVSQGGAGGGSSVSNTVDSSTAPASAGRG